MQETQDKGLIPGSERAPGGGNGNRLQDCCLGVPMDRGSWHHLVNRHEFEQTLGEGEGQGSLLGCCPWGCKESDMTEQLNNNNNNSKIFFIYINAYKFSQ